MITVKIPIFLKQILIVHVSFFVSGKSILWGNSCHCCCMQQQLKEHKETTGIFKTLFSIPRIIGSGRINIWDRQTSLNKQKRITEYIDWKVK